MNRIVRYGIIGIAVALSAAGCSTTSRLGQDEVLYTGVKKISDPSRFGRRALFDRRIGH